jgi:plastocyanin
VRSSLLCLLLISCSSESGPPTIVDDVSIPQKPPVNPLPVSVSGTVTLRGEPLGPRRILIDRLDGPLRTTLRKRYPGGLAYLPVEVDPEHRVRSALVYVKKGLEDKSFEVPSEPKYLDIESCMFTPRLLVVRVGQKIIVRNNDDALHVGMSQGFENPQGGPSGLSQKGSTWTHTFAKEEVAVRVGCPIHGEASWAAILSHPFFGVTDLKGHFEIRGLPPGRYTLEVWREGCKRETKEVELRSEEPSITNFEIEAFKE